MIYEQLGAMVALALQQDWDEVEKIARTIRLTFNQDGKPIPKALAMEAMLKPSCVEAERSQRALNICEEYAMELRRDAADMESRNVNPLQVNQLRAMASGVEVASSRIACSTSPRKD